MWKPEMWKEHWGGMPEFTSEDCTPFYTLRVILTKQEPPAGKKEAFITVQFKKDNLSKNVNEVAERLRCPFTAETERITLDTDESGVAQLLYYGKKKISHHACWFPWKENDPHSKYEYQGGGTPMYPVYILSKGRWELPLTARALERLSIPYTIVVEPSEYEEYKKTFSGTYDSGVLYTYGALHKTPENFSERKQGSIPVRNYIWDLAIKAKTGRHWLMDDNIPTFNRTNYVPEEGANLGIRVTKSPTQAGGGIFRAVETFADRYENVAITGLQNSQFVVAKQGKGRGAFFLNTRVYSCTLIQNDLRLPTKVKGEDRWRGRYNEDTDLCIRALKAGLCTVLFVTFNADKVGTMVMKGGNTDELYAGDGRLKMAQSLADQHPEEVRVVTKWARAQHSVSYPKCVEIGKKAVPNGCILKPKTGLIPKSVRDEFGMVLVEIPKSNKEPDTMKRISVEQKEKISQLHGEGKTHGEIASVVGVSKQSVSKLVATGAKRNIVAEVTDKDLETYSKLRQKVARHKREFPELFV